MALERKYAALYEGATDALFAIDSEGGFRALNRQAEVLSGYSREELDRLKIWDVIDPAETRDWIVHLLRTTKPPLPRAGKKRPMVDTW